MVANLRWLDRLVKVFEPNGAITNYAHVFLNNLSTIGQEGLAGDSQRTRTF